MIDYHIETRTEPDGTVVYSCVLDLPKEWTSEQRREFYDEWCKVVQDNFRRRYDDEIDKLFFGR